MIGIVVVSHSRALARAAVDLAREMAPEPPPIAIAAGLDETTFGTDASAIAEAIAEVASPDGVLVLLDLGSAILSTEMALEFCDPELADRVRLSPAPLVEGLVAAVVTAASGASLDEVADEAGAGAAAKLGHLGGQPPPAPGSPEGNAALVDGSPGEDADASIEWSARLDLPHGLHARPAAALVAALRGLDVRAEAGNRTTGAGPVPAGSLTRLATLGLRLGHVLGVRLRGSDAETARAALDALANARFGETASPGSPGTAAVPGTPDGPSAGAPPAASPDASTSPPASSRQIVLAPALVRSDAVDLSGYRAGGDEAGRLEAARAGVRARLAEGGDDILAMQAEMLDDPDLTSQFAAALARGEDAATAVDTVLTATAAEFAALPDPYQAERAQDLRSLRRLLLARLLGTDSRADPSGTERPDAALPAGGHVLVLPELDAATAVGLDPSRTLGVLTTSGGATGHGVIVASGRGIPVVTGRGEFAGLVTGQVLGLDPASGDVWVDPQPDVVADIERRRARRADDERAAHEAAHRPASTRGGQRIRVEANVGSLADATRAASEGAEGFGLVRTELLFADRTEAPSAEEQADVFVRIGSAALDADGRHHPSTIRTWDVGGDKPLPYLAQAPELNPFLGERGLRTMRRVPAFFREQLRGIALASRDVPVRVMFPMVTEPEEMAWAREQALAVMAEVGVEPVPIGMMVEVPAAALRAAEFAGLVDFVSIGTNDLTQYTTATDRTNGTVAHLARSDSAGVLALMRLTCGHLPGVPVAVCGDLASRPELTATLVGMGVTELSVRPPLVAQVKQAVRGV